MRARSAPRSASGLIASPITLPTSCASASSRPRMVAAGVPMRTPEAIVGGRSSNGTVLRLTVMRMSCSRSSMSLPESALLRRSSWTRCVSVPPVSSSPPCSAMPRPSDAALALTARW